MKAIGYYKQQHHRKTVLAKQIAEVTAKQGAKNWNNMFEQASYTVKIAYSDIVPRAAKQNTVCNNTVNIVRQIVFLQFTQEALTLVRPDEQQYIGLSRSLEYHHKELLQNVERYVCFIQ